MGIFGCEELESGVLTFIALAIYFLAKLPVILLASGSFAIIKYVYKTWPTEEIPPQGVDAREWMR